MFLSFKEQRSQTKSFWFLNLNYVTHTKRLKKENGMWSAAIWSRQVRQTKDFIHRLLSGTFKVPSYHQRWYVVFKYKRLCVTFRVAACYCIKVFPSPGSISHGISKTPIKDKKKKKRQIKAKCNYLQISQTHFFPNKT